MGWALVKPRAGPSMFTDTVKKCLTVKFDLGEQMGHKPDPLQVSNHMRKAKDAQNNRLFTREEWLTKSQVQGFFLPSQWQKKDKVLQKLNLTIEICYKKTRSSKGISLLQKSLKNWDNNTHWYDAFNLRVCTKINLLQFNVATIQIQRKKKRCNWRTFVFHIRVNVLFSISSGVNIGILNLVWLTAAKTLGI